MIENEAQTHHVLSPSISSIELQGSLLVLRETGKFHFSLHEKKTLAERKRIKKETRKRTRTQRNGREKRIQYNSTIDLDKSERKYDMFKRAMSKAGRGENF